MNIKRCIQPRHFAFNSKAFFLLKPKTPCLFGSMPKQTDPATIRRAGPPTGRACCNTEYPVRCQLLLHSSPRTRRGLRAAGGGLRARSTATRRRRLASGSRPGALKVTDSKMHFSSQFVLECQRMSPWLLAHAMVLARHRHLPAPGSAAAAAGGVDGCGSIVRARPPRSAPPAR
jgi:hypothetical protein